MNSIEDFVNKFYSLGGSTVAEKEKNFRSLICNNITLLQNQNSNEIIISKVTPRTYLENSFKVELLIVCHRMRELMEIFMSGNEISISRIIKHGWFLQEAFQHMTAQDITNNLLPHLSYSIRMKVLKKMCIHLNDVNKLHDIFHSVKSRYGLKFAIPVFLGCSEYNREFIIRNNPIFLTPRQLRLFIKTTPKLLPIYVEEYVKHTGNCKFLSNNELLRYLASIDYSVYNILQEKYGIEAVFGKRMSKKIFDKEKENILMNPQNYQYVFRKSVFVRRLGLCGSFKNYVQTLFPKDLEDFNYTKFCNIHDLLRFCPKLRQFQILDETFKNMYHMQIDDCPQKIFRVILDMISDPNRRSQIVQKIMAINDDIENVVHLKTSESIPYIKKEMDLATNKVSKRKELIKALVQTCKINNDSNALKEVLKYSLVRHRNDIDALESFFVGLMNNYNFHDFDEATWKIINEVVVIYKMKKANIGFLRDVLLTFAEILYNNNKPFEEPLFESMNTGFSPYEHIFSHTCTNLEFIHAALLNVIELLPKVLKKEHLQNGYCNFVTRLISWNKSHSNYAILLSDHPVFFDSLKKQGEIAVYYDIRYLVCSKDRNEEIIKIVDFQWDKHLTCYTNVFYYYLKWYPYIFTNHMNSSVKALTNNHSHSTKIINTIKKYEHLELPQNIIRNVQEDLNKLQTNNRDDEMEVENQGEDKKQEIVKKKLKILARFMNSEDYINYVAKYKPNSLSVDMTNHDEKEMYRIQCHIITNYKYLSPSLALPQVLEYCGGDFLKYALSPLYKSFYRIPENQIQSFLSQLMNKSISVRKHTVFLAFQLLDLNSMKEILKSVLDSEKNSSLRKRFVQTSLKLFQQNASDEIWNIFKYSISFIDETDKESYDKLVNVSYIPFNYFTLYFEEVWLLIKQCNILACHKYDFLNKLVCKMNSHMKQLSSEFCLEVIKSLFFHFPHDYFYDRMSINTFICEYLLHHQEPERFMKIYRILETKKMSSSDDLKLSTKVCEETRMFIYKFCKYIITSGKACVWDQPNTINFLNQLSSMYPDIEFFNEYLLILIVLVLLKLQQKNIENYTSELTIFNQGMFATYGPYVTNFLATIIADSLKYFKQRDETALRIKFIKELLKNSNSEFSFDIALKILALCDSRSPEYKSLKDIFVSCPHLYVQITLKQKSLFPENA